MRRLVLCLCLLCSLQLWGDSLKDMKNKVTKINRQISAKNKRIKKINVEKSSLQKQIAKARKELAENKKHRKEIEDDIQIVSKNVQYGRKNYEVSKKALKSKKGQYDAKMIHWSRYSKAHAGELADQPLLKRHFQQILHSDLKDMEKILNLQGDIRLAKEDIEAEKKKLEGLRRNLAKNIAEGNRKEAEKNRLIARLNSEQKRHKGSIRKLLQEKKAMEAKIKRIIKQRSKKDKKVVKKSVAYTKLGKTLKPVKGRLMLSYGQKKSGKVRSSGIELKARMGAPIQAAASGKVIYAGDFQGLRKVVMIDYGYNMIGLYGNLVSLNCKLNQRVKAGQRIGILGVSTEGNPHLYYELRFNLHAIDPMPSF